MGIRGKRVRESGLSTARGRSARAEAEPGKAAAAASDGRRLSRRARTRAETSAGGRGGAGRAQPHSEGAPSRKTGAAPGSAGRPALGASPGRGGRRSRLGRLRTRGEASSARGREARGGTGRGRGEPSAVRGAGDDAEVAGREGAPRQTWGAETSWGAYSPRGPRKDQPRGEAATSQRPGRGRRAGARPPSFLPGSS